MAAQCTFKVLLVEVSAKNIVISATMPWKGLVKETVPFFHPEKNSSSNGALTTVLDIGP